MLTFASPWILLLLPFPLLLRRWLPPYLEYRSAVRVTWFQRLAELLDKKPMEGSAPQEKNVYEAVLSWVCWGLIILALARPQFIQPPVTKILPTRDVLLAVDLSGSMATEDFTDAKGHSVDRLTAVKEVLDQFLTTRQGDRVGLIVFGNAPFVQIPFTQDLEACRQLLAETGLRMAGPKTAFGDAIGLGITLFERSEVEYRVMIALTDGNDTGSAIPPAEAAKIASDNNIVIHVVGIGDPTTSGEDKLDEEVLKLVAENTGGRYFHGADRAQLGEIYSELDKMDSREIETLSYNPKIDLFHIPLMICVLLQLCFYTVLLVTRIRERMAEDG